MQKCYLAMGCFWKPEEKFKTQKGIIDTEVGYAGGYKSKVSYEEVCQGNSGHAEVVKLSFDENGLLLRTSQEIEPREMYDSFKNQNHIESLYLYLLLLD